MPLNGREFDTRCNDITHRLQVMRDWKHNYYGAAYTTRLEQLALDLRGLAERVEELIRDDKNG